ncbi:nuclear transport factor 2 family protein [Allostreptomyces psammosilenae]|uniref:Actinorhodin biosynthesis protein ActVIA n=1 Tax=Allostreptomyces psammosilenae TaxID=1892865 RepID=A0A853ACN2_9ACTN|nr:nuclear transport factor 2 family protein [Allostreptomyces psammosilenae]NYI08311.1 actinorhodin biosynthesis protein ActVIA [Allostreptomyces psammosilenae]
MSAMPAVPAPLAAPLPRILTWSFGDLYTRVQQLYAVQMHALDAADFEGFAATFTEDAQFSYAHAAAPISTRSGIADHLREFRRRKFGDEPVQQRHWIGMINVEPQDGGTVKATHYTLIHTVHADGRPVPGPAAVVRDYLALQSEELLVRCRRITHDHRR